MAGLQVTTTIGADTTIDNAALETCKASLRGELLCLMPGQTFRFQPNAPFRGPLSLLVEWDA